jgi:hypothetical protein
VFEIVAGEQHLRRGGRGPCWSDRSNGAGYAASASAAGCGIGDFST